MKIKKGELKMKTKIGLLMIVFIVAIANLNAQEKTETDTELLELPGDNLDLYATLDLFQESKTIEEFEASLNDEKTGINNLDLNVDDEVDFIKVVNPVKLNNLERTKFWQGKVQRINGKVDQASLTIRVFIEVNANDLREGMYLEAVLEARPETNAYEIDKKLLFENDKLFAVKDTSLILIEIVPVYFNEKTVIVKGLENGTKLISKPLPGAFEGMKVKVNKKNQAR